ncbi:MAG: tRNA dimethylallyltransferase [Brockia lithotrophica]|uniref:tRNA dimethylallyltransferase n=1 Tax=Brockia lithotrophica TaxID=933949 RepID=A0A2T5G8M6_9BACL|nr:MAG: tRNA dimethylallyltransferase [Brockia lithotrophica]
MLTTSLREPPSPEVRERLSRLADSYGLPVVPRRGRPWARLFAETGARWFLAVTESPPPHDLLLVLPDLPYPLFFHPGMALRRIKALREGKSDLMVQVSSARSGDVVFDATLGLGGDAAVWSFVVGESGAVTGVEGSLPIYVLFREGRTVYPFPDEDVRRAYLRIDARLGDFRDVLPGLPPASVDVVFFDPMFPAGSVPGSSTMAAVRRVALDSPLRREDVEAACRAARRLVLVKTSVRGTDFASLGLVPLLRRQGASFTYGLRECGPGAHGRDGSSRGEGVYECGGNPRGEGVYEREGRLRGEEGAAEKADDLAGAPLIALVGPTAVGKTALSLELAERFPLEIVNADAMQVYRGMEIGTDKVAPEIRRRIPHHLLDIRDPWESFSVAEYQKLALQAIREILARGRIPLLVGGTGLYVNAVVYYPDYDFSSPGRDPARRERWYALAEKVGPERLWERARALVPEVASVHPRDVRRTVRALERLGISPEGWEAEFSASGAPTGGQPVEPGGGDSAFAGSAPRGEGSLPPKKRRQSPFRLLFLGITMERTRLYRRIEARVDEQIARGLLEEARSLLEAGLDAEATALQALGYKELVPVLRGETTLEEAVRLIKRRTKQYAKRQLSWFRGLPDVRWFPWEEEVREESRKEIFALVAGFFCTGANST